MLTGHKCLLLSEFFFLLLSLFHNTLHAQLNTLPSSSLSYLIVLFSTFAGQYRTSWKGTKVQVIFCDSPVFFSFFFTFIKKKRKSQKVSLSHDLCWACHLAIGSCQKPLSYLGPINVVCEKLCLLIVISMAFCIYLCCVFSVYFLFL